MDLQTLQQIREAAGVSRGEAAKALGITEPAYWKKEAGQRPFRPNEALILAPLYGVPATKLIFAPRMIATQENAS